MWRQQTGSFCSKRPTRPFMRNNNIHYTDQWVMLFWEYIVVLFANLLKKSAMVAKDTMYGVIAYDFFCMTPANLTVFNR